MGYEFRVSSKQTKIIFGSNRNKPKQDLFRVCFGLFRETKNKKFRFVSVFRTYMETTETNRTVSWQTETNRNNPKVYEKYPNILSFKLFGWVFCLFRINRNSLLRYRSETTETPKQTVSKHTEKTENKPKKPEKNKKKTEKTEKNHTFSVKNCKTCALSHCFGWSFVCFCSIETSTLSVSV